jgi:hypothetical protein
MVVTKKSKAAGKGIDVHAGHAPPMQKGSMTLPLSLAKALKKRERQRTKSHLSLREAQLELQLRKQSRINRKLKGMLQFALLNHPMLQCG